MIGQEPNQKLIVDINTEEWIAFNKEYYKLRSMEYYIQYKIPEVVALRKHMHALVDTDQFEKIEAHWKKVTMDKQHQTVVAHQANMVKQGVKVLHVAEDEKRWMDPAVPQSCSTSGNGLLLLHGCRQGYLEPMLDFMIDGEYDDDYVKAVNPHFDAP